LVGKKPKPPLFRDNRRAKRRPVHHPAWAQLDSNRRPIECVVKDMSDTGARLSIMASIAPLPEQFTLWLDKNGKVKRSCEIVWRRADYVGVRFAGRDRKSQ
jgi:hypothetical protein